MMTDEDARLFALLGNVVADARIAAFESKCEQKLWRPITAINANASGAVTSLLLLTPTLLSQPDVHGYLGRSVQAN
jgi:hypothetical protein